MRASSVLTRTVFKLRILGLAALMALLLAGTLAPDRALAGEPNLAGLVVQLDSGQVETRCIAFEEDQLNGADLLSRSGLEVVLNPASSMGITVCRIEGLGCDYPAEHCFCQCMGGGGCTYWNYFYREPGGTEWVYSALGAAMHKVRPGSVEGWVWGNGQSPPPDSLSFEAICVPPTPTVSPTPRQEPTDTPGGRETPTGSPTAQPTATAPAPTVPAAARAQSPTPTPLPNAGSSQDLADYWPFGLTLLSLGIAGAIVWFRRARPAP